MGELQLLRSGDEARTYDFLERHVDSSMFFLSNIERAGLEFHGAPFQGTYVAHCDDHGITALAGHSWSGMLLVQGDAGLEDAACEVARRSGRPVRGLSGPLDAVRRAKRALGMEHRPTSLDGDDLLFALDLDALIVPPLASDPTIESRAPNRLELEDPLVSWRVDYHVETLGRPRSTELADVARRELDTMVVDAIVLLHQGQLVSFTAFNAKARGIVQVGGVWTPPALRGRGYARAAIARSLLAARSTGARRSILFTERSNTPAIRAYTALGYRTVGHFGLVLFA